VLKRMLNNIGDDDAQGMDSALHWRPAAADHSADQHLGVGRRDLGI
jgi:hypothetical protein